MVSRCRRSLAYGMLRTRLKDAARSFGDSNRVAATRRDVRRQRGDSVWIVGKPEVEISRPDRFRMARHSTGVEHDF